MTDENTGGKPKARRRSGRTRSGGGSAKAKRKAARLAAVQALYQIDLNSLPITGKSVEAVLIEFMEHRFGHEVDGDSYVAADPQLFADVLRGACHRRGQVDELLAAALDQRHSLDRLELPLRAILRAGAFELFANLTTHSRIIISEYVDVAHGFYAGREPGMVNGVLDKVAKTLRTEDTDGQGGPVADGVAADADGADDDA